MSKLVITLKGNHVVYCDNEDDLFSTLEKFENYLTEYGVRPYVRIGSLYHENFSFNFDITTIDQEERNIIYNFFRKKEITKPSTFRILVEKESERYYYPFNDLKSALLVYKILEQESSAKIELLRFYPNKNNKWIIWRDKNKRTAKDLSMQIIQDEIVIE